MRVVMFQNRFGDKVKSGAKRQTIRPVPKRIPRRGDTLSLRCWSGKPYRSKQRVLIQTTLEQIKFCRIDKKGILLTVAEGVDALQGESADRFAREDGFKDWSEMREWFRLEHCLPFYGVVLYWR